MAYATISKPGLYFNTVLYTGNGSTPRTVSGVGFQPDFTWIKNRTASSKSHVLVNVIQGYGSSGTTLKSNSTDAAENTSTTGRVANPGATTDGFTVGDSSFTNDNSQSIVAWNWKANGAASANTDGTAANVTVSANTTAGFSIVQFDATQSRVSVGHGLGSTPDAIIMKQTEAGGSGWIVGGFGLDWSGYLSLQDTAAFNNNNNDSSGTGRMFTPDGYAPTASVWSTNGSAFLSGGTKTCIAYCFKSIKGYSKFGNYVGNGDANGTFVYTGFKPAWVIIKQSSDTRDWIMVDNKRDPDNVVSNRLFPNNSDAQNTNNDMLDFTSNGFKIRNTNTTANVSGGTYIYMAFAEEPLVANVGASIPATAR